MSTDSTRAQLEALRSKIQNLTWAEPAIPEKHVPVSEYGALLWDPEAFVWILIASRGSGLRLSDGIVQEDADGTDRVIGSLEDVISGTTRNVQTKLDTVREVLEELVRMSLDEESLGEHEKALAQDILEPAREWWEEVQWVFRPGEKPVLLDALWPLVHREDWEEIVGSRRYGLKNAIEDRLEHVDPDALPTRANPVFPLPLKPYRHTEMSEADITRETQEAEQLRRERTALAALFDDYEDVMVQPKSDFRGS